MSFRDLLNVLEEFVFVGRDISVFIENQRCSFSLEFEIMAFEGLKAHGIEIPLVVLHSPLLIGIFNGTGILSTVSISFASV